MISSQRSAFGWTSADGLVGVQRERKCLSDTRLFGQVAGGGRPEAKGGGGYRNGGLFDLRPASGWSIVASGRTWMPSAAERHRGPRDCQTLTELSGDHAMQANTRTIFIGIKGTVLALDRATGEELWRTPLKGGDIVNLVLDGGNLLASARGEVDCLDPNTSDIRWNNPLRRLGWAW